jgi:hypothetical protein
MDGYIFDWGMGKGKGLGENHQGRGAIDSAVERGVRGMVLGGEGRPERLRKMNE